MAAIRAFRMGNFALSWAAVILSIGCGDPRCPRGYDQRGDTCYRIKDGGTDASGLEDAASAVSSDPDQRVNEGGIKPILDAGEDPSMADSGTPGSASMQCDHGSELSEAGTCVDIDECARGLDSCDDDPPACVNTENGLGFSCACPTGYRGDGQGTDGCADIDECGEQADSCDELAPCNNGPGSYSCGDCPAGHAAGAPGACNDIDECVSNNGGCDTSPLADCLNQVGMANTCRCPAGYTGNGVGGQGCVDEDECLVNNGGCDTSPMATCTNRTGAPRTCTCPTGSSGNGVGASGCMDMPDCTASSCKHLGRCIDGVNGFTCDCSGTGYSGTTCEFDPCNPNPCGPGLICTRTPSATASCTAACAATGCEPGDVCATDADCKTGGDNTATCDQSDKVCVRVCPAATVVSQASLDAIRYCKEINGDLKFEPNFATVDATALPYLTRVRGSLLAMGGIAGALLVESITIPNLQIVDGSVNFALLPLLKVLSLPRLTSARSLSVTTNGSLTHVSLPQLSTVTDSFGLSINAALERVDIGRLTTVGQRVSLRSLCRLPWSQVQPISMLGATQEILDIGCCNMSTDKFACQGACTCR